MDADSPIRKESSDQPTDTSTLSIKKVRFGDSETGWYGDLVSIRLVESYKAHNKLPKSSTFDCACKVL